MEKQKQKARVIALPTDKPTGLFRIGPQWFNSVVMKTRTDNEGYHLYFVTDEKIKEEDWVYHPEATKPFRATKENQSAWVVYQKIVATTNPELWGKTLPCGEKWASMEGESLTVGGIPKIAPDFVEAFVKAQGEINEVLLGYKAVQCSIMDDKAELLKSPTASMPVAVKWELDLNASGQVKVYPVEQILYTRKDMNDAVLGVCIYALYCISYEGKASGFPGVADIQEWFDETYPEQ